MNDDIRFFASFRLVCSCGRGTGHDRHLVEVLEHAHTCAASVKPFTTPSAEGAVYGHDVAMGQAIRSIFIAGDLWMLRKPGVEHLKLRAFLEFDVSCRSAPQSE